MRHEWSAPDANETEICRLAERLALKVSRGDVIALSGGLGAGKTTFARALIRAVLDDPNAEVQSPTFSLMQIYEAPRLTLAHLDLYRLAGAGDTAEIGAAEVGETGALIVEWPERAPELLGDNRLEIRLDDGASDDTRSLRVTGFGTWASRLARVEEISAFLASVPGWGDARVSYLQGDASVRAYARLDAGDKRAVLMDHQRQPDGPPIRDGLPYSRIAHLAEDARPFVAIASVLRGNSLSVPDIYAADLASGLLLIEDFGSRAFGREIESGTSQAELWRAATATLAAVRALPPPPSSLTLADGSTYSLPDQDRGVLEIEAELLLDWYWPLAKGSAVPDAERREFLRLWNDVFDRLLALPQGWVLRDFHSPNLMWLPERTGSARVGILDFQDALRGPAAYDLVSVLQDARIDVPREIEAALFDEYCALAEKHDPAFDSGTFGFAYAALGAQRNTKILGIFARLAKRDGKPQYLAHMPRIWRYLARDLAHTGLGALGAWYDRNFPAAMRTPVKEHVQ